MPRFVPYRPPHLPVDEVLARAEANFQEADARRSVRLFSSEPVPRRAIELAIQAASTAPSGAHQQPWTFVAVGDPEIKHRIRLAAEAEERENYEGGRMPPEWVEELAQIGTDWHKDFLEVVPWIVVLFEQTHGAFSDGSLKKHYYARESVGIACGMFIAAIHRMADTLYPQVIERQNKLTQAKSGKTPAAGPAAQRPEGLLRAQKVGQLINHGLGLRQREGERIHLAHCSSACWMASSSSPRVAGLVR